MVLNHNVHAMPSNHPMLISHVDFHLRFGRETTQSQLVEKSIPVDRFEKSRAQRPMQFHSCTDDRMRQCFALHAPGRALSLPQSVESAESAAFLTSRDEEVQPIQEAAHAFRMDPENGGG